MVPALTRIAIILETFLDEHIAVLMREGWSVGDDGFVRDYPDGPAATVDLERLWARLESTGHFSGSARHVTPHAWAEVMTRT